MVPRIKTLPAFPAFNSNVTPISGTRKKVAPIPRTETMMGIGIVTAGEARHEGGLTKHQLVRLGFYLLNPMVELRERDSTFYCLTALGMLVVRHTSRGVSYCELSMKALTIISQYKKNLEAAK